MLENEGDGVGPVKKIKALDSALETWRDLGSKRMALGKQEVDAREVVIQLMHKHNVARYPWSDSDDVEKIITLDATEKLKLKKAEEAGDETEAE